MPFIGKQPAVGSFTLLDSITTSATATYALTKNGDAFYPETARNLLVSLNGVTQAPEDAYTVSGSNIVFASALTSSDVIDYILVLGDVLDIGQPSDGTVGVPQMNSALYSENEFFALPTGTTAQRPASPSEGYIRQNTTLNQLEIYADGAWQKVKDTDVVAASGGTETTITQDGIYYKVHTFTSSGTFTVTNGGEVDYLIVAGGGGGGGAVGDGWLSGGGGAGGYLHTQGATISSGTYTITVGAGGATGTPDGNSAGSNTTQGSDGGDSSFGAIATTVGGGGGGASSGLSSAGSKTYGRSGGSGGGAGVNFNSSTPPGGSGTSGQGNDGGAGSTTGNGYAGGGGGAGGSGQSATTGAGSGGSGAASSISGSSVTYATGGDIGISSPSNEAANTGNGGDSPLSPSGYAINSGAGGSGIVIIRYQI